MRKSHFKKAIASLEARIAEHQLILELQEECQIDELKKYSKNELDKHRVMKNDRCF